MITADQVREQVEMLEASGMGHGKALQMVKRRLKLVTQLKRQMLDRAQGKVAEPSSIDILTAQVTSHINLMERTMRIERTIRD